MALLPYIVTSFVFTLIHSIFPGSECEHTNRLFISVQFQSFLLSGKTGKTFIKYTDSGTKTTHLAGYNILVFKYVKISVGLPILSIGAIHERRSKIRYCIIWQCLHLMFSTTKCFRKMKHARLWKNVILWVVFQREVSPLVVSFLKK